MFLYQARRVCKIYQSVILALSYRALQSIENVTLQKEQGISQKAKDIAAGAGESDLRRLKRQFASLKNTYMLYDTKEHFLDGGLPSAVILTPFCTGNSFVLYSRRMLPWQDRALSL